MDTIKHIGRDGAILLAFVLAAFLVTLLAQFAADVIMRLGEMMM
ncbi:hypothetical protein GCM10011380_23500 [Sphingomonas metalli]|uniref:Uncharacterized protein n=1 Tax=Sphingomonas metalli TaxID=1779358 RepID=A0A916T6B9_9SPHN|nr:hypothetical protein [Sphingomonas metalli]GGB33349.1 hypothetical protein GCM10011380_23500 [Sphingomonas metalli]